MGEGGRALKLEPGEKLKIRSNHVGLFKKISNIRKKIIYKENRYRSADRYLGQGQNTYMH